MDQSSQQGRTLGLVGATGVGVGAIVGGGILALAGVGFAAAGPSTLVAFLLNGVIALLTVLTFADLAARFPESGGTYTFARKVLAVEAAFAVGWVVWFASVVAAVLYALGFAAFLVPVLQAAWHAGGGVMPDWLGERFALLGYALAAVGFYAWSLSRSASGGGQWATVGKLVVFLILIVGGGWVLITAPPSPEQLASSFSPFFAKGGVGLLQAMGYTFIALQGFDLIAAVGGEVKRPERTIPRAMLLSLAVTLVIYLPLLFLIITIGTPGQSVTAAAAAEPEILVAVAARNFLGPTGYWLVILAGLMSMLSALQANLLAASRFALTMARDRTLPQRFARLIPARRTPVAAIQLTAIVVALVLIAVPSVAAAGAMSSLIFLGTFALAHAIAYLVRRRTGGPGPFRVPAFPLVPIAGGMACVGLALFQSLAVPSAGVLAALWLSLGAVFFVVRIAPRARTADASAEAMDPELVRLRGRHPVVLVPIANPESASRLVTLADALAPRGVSRVLLLSVVRPPEEDWQPGQSPQQLLDAQAILGGALTSAFTARLTPEALITVGSDPWDEIARAAARYDCETLALGVGHLGEEVITGPLERLISATDCDVVIVRAPATWSLAQAHRILVAAGGRRDQSTIRARLLGSLARATPREVTYLRVVGAAAEVAEARESLETLARDEVPGESHVEVMVGSDPVTELASRATDVDLLVLGLQRVDRRNKHFGPRVIEIARRTDCPLLMISQR